MKTIFRCLCLLSVSLCYGQIVDSIPEEPLSAEALAPDSISTDRIIEGESRLRPEEPMDAAALQIGETGGTAHVLSNMGILEGSPDAPLSIRAASTGDQALYQSWRYTAGSDQYTLKLKQTVTSGVVRYTFDMINNSTAYNNVLTFDRGNVGIGATNPVAKLDVRGHVGIDGASGITIGGWNSNTPDATPRAQLVLDGAHNAGYNLGTKLLISGIDNESNQKAISVVDENSNELFYLQSQPVNDGQTYFKGNVGIGRTDPSYKLDVNGTSRFSNNMILPGIGTNEIQYGTGDQANYSTYNFAIRGWWGVALKDYSNTVRGVYDFRSGNLTTDGVLRFNGTGNNYLAGNLGIGVASPTEKLSVNGALVTQNGKVKRDFATFSSTANVNTPIHIKTNITWSNIMYRILVEGYNYGASQPINSEVVGYTYSAVPTVIYNPSAINHTSGASISQYKSDDGYLVVKLSHGSSFYYVGFSVSAWLTNPAGNAFDIKALEIVQQPNDMVSAITYTQSFTSGVTPSSQCTAWNNFRASLTGTYSSIKMSGTYNTTGIECSGTTANSIAQALRTGTGGSWSCGGYTWYIGTCGSGIELSVNQAICQCNNPGYSIRPCIGNTNWGGVNTATCSGPTQTMTVEVR